MAGRKRFLESVRDLQKIDPDVLRALLRKFPTFLETRKLDLSEKSTDQHLQYDAIKSALMDGDVPPELDDVLFFVNKLGNAHGQDQLEKEAKLRKRQLDFRMDSVSCLDFPIRVWLHEWPRNRDLLEAAYARARIFAKSSYVYFPMRQDYRPRFQVPTEERLAVARAELEDYFANREGLGKGTNVVQYDFETELWFLVRYPGQVKRHREFNKEGKADTHTFRPEEYDAIVYHKEYGDLRLNTNRSRDHVQYRIMLAHLLFDESNVFDPNTKIVSLDPLLGECLGIFKCDDIEDLESIRPVEVCFSLIEQPGVRVTWRADDHSSLLEHNRQGMRLLPKGAHSVLYAKFHYRLRDRTRWERMTVHRGQALRYERDGDCVIVEEWLRRRKFVKNPIDAS